MELLAPSRCCPAVGRHSSSRRRATPLVGHATCRAAPIPHGFSGRAPVGGGCREFAETLAWSSRGPSAYARPQIHAHASGDDVVEIYDTTLRDGAQMVGISLTAQNKLDVARQLVLLGAPYIEGGYPGSNPKDKEFFARWKEIDTGSVGTKLAAFGSTRHKNTLVEEDKQIHTLLDSGAEVLTIVAKAWDEQVEHVLEATLPQNLSMIEDSVSYLKEHGRTVMVDLEHFFDGCKSSQAYSMECLRVAAAAGADYLVLCDTNGGCLPWEVEEMCRQVVAEIAEWPECKVGIHTHNDTGMAVANSLAAVRGGARLVQGCINGYGERTGNADLCSVVAGLQIKMGFSCVPDGRLERLASVSRTVAKICEQPPPTQTPYVGSSAFAHKGGLHVAAVRKLPHSYNHCDPALVGNAMRSVVSELSGKGNVLSIAEKFSDVDIDAEGARQVLAEIKQLESTGYSFEGASASVDMMVLRKNSLYSRPFRVLEFSVITQNRGGSGDGDHPTSEKTTINQAMVKIEVDGAVEMVASEGNGPVNALSICLRKSLDPKYPQLRRVRLADYSVRLLDTRGSHSTTRVTINFCDDDGRKWATVGAHASIVEASFRALEDGLEYAISQCDLEGCDVAWGEGGNNNEEEEQGDYSGDLVAAS